MSTWIFKSARRLLAPVLIILSLAACAGGPEVSMRAGSFDFLSGAAEMVKVADRSVVIAGPPGYCVHTSATRDRETGTFVLLGSCAAITNNRIAAAPGVPAMLTASVSGPSPVATAKSLPGLQAFFNSEAGRATLARNGQAASVSILQTRRRGDAFYIHLRDKSDNIVPSLASEYWRGVFDINGRIVTVSVHGFRDEPMSSSAGLATLTAFADRIRKENAATTTVENG